MSNLAGFTNLVINAGQASKPGDTINIHLLRTDEQAVVEVSDQGCGIDDEIKSKLFMPHFTTKLTGSGLGLASCKQIIEVKHGGTLSCHTNGGQGTTFKFTLPFQSLAQPSPAFL